jgi:hypothetical protein
MPRPVLACSVAPVLVLKVSSNGQRYFKAQARSRASHRCANPNGQAITRSGASLSFQAQDLCSGASHNKTNMYHNMGYLHSAQSQDMEWVVSIML